MKFVSIVSALFLTLSIAACSASGGSQGAESPTSESTRSSNTTVSEADFLETVAAAHAKHTSAHTHLEVSTDSDTFSMSGPVAWGSDSGDIGLDIASKSSQRETTIQMMMLGHDFYIKGRAGFPEGKFIRFDLSDADNQMHKQGAFFERQLSPSGFIAELESNGAKVTAKGDGPTIDGVKTSTWLVSVDPKALTALSEAIRVGDKLELTLWLGEDNLLRQLETPITGGTLTQSWTEWGKEHVIAAPKKSDTLDFTQIVGPLSGS